MQNKDIKKSFIDAILNNDSKKNKNDLIKTFIKNKQQAIPKGVLNVV